MFFVESLMNSENLGNVWKAANNLEIDYNKESDLPEICRSLDTWISSEALRIERRLSLRTSATLVNGAARMYKSDTDKLFDDAIMLNEKMSRRNRIYGHIPSGYFDSSESTETPERVREHNIQRFETSITPNKRAKTISSSTTDVTPSYSISRSPERISSDNTNSYSSTHISRSESPHNPKDSRNTSISPEKSTKGQTTNVSPIPSEKSTKYQAVQSSPISPEKSTEENTINISPIPLEISIIDQAIQPSSTSPEKLTNQQPIQPPPIPPEKSTKDKAIQTLPFIDNQERSNDSFGNEFNKELPFAYVLLHDSYHSRFPNKIILSSINSDVNNLT